MQPYLLRIIYIRYLHRYLHTNSTYKYRIYIIRSRYLGNGGANDDDADLDLDIR